MRLRRMPSPFAKDAKAELGADSAQVRSLAIHGHRDAKVTDDVPAVAAAVAQVNHDVDIASRDCLCAASTTHIRMICDQHISRACCMFSSARAWSMIFI